MKKLLGLLSIFTVLVLVLTACGEDDPAEARAIFDLDRVYLDGQEVSISDTNYGGSRLTFIGEEAGGNVIIRVGEVDIQASINPSRQHSSFDTGYWHHHLYSGSTASGSPRINFMELLPDLGIDDIEEAAENNQSAYQRGNLHYIVETGEFRLRLRIDGVVHDLIFAEQ